MPRDLFTAPSDSPETRRSTRLLPVSIALHALALFAAVIVPLFASGELPPIAGQRMVAMLASPVPPPPLPPVMATAQRTHATQTAPPAREPHFMHPGPPVPSSVPVGPGGLESVTQGLPGVGLGEPLLGGGLPGPPASKAGVSSGPRKVGGDIRTPRKLRHVAPEYPAIARHAGIEGTVVIDAIVGEDGRVQQATIRESKPLLDQAALRAVRQWEYTPTRLNGVPVAVIMTVEVHFRLR
jgi:protein TonB